MSDSPNRGEIGKKRREKRCFLVLNCKFFLLYSSNDGENVEVVHLYLATWIMFHFYEKKFVIRPKRSVEYEWIFFPSLL